MFMQHALDLLDQDFYLNYPLIRALRHGAELIAANEYGVAQYRYRPDFMQLAGPNPLDLVKDAPRPDLIQICGSHSARAAAAYFGLEGIFECYQFYYPYQTIESDLPLEPITLKDLDFVLEHYHRLEPEEVEQAIQEERIFGLRDYGKLFAFIGLHEDYAMGMLHILPEYRRQGWGERLERALTARVLAMGELPYGQVFIENDASMWLQEKLGFVQCSDKVYWMWRTESTPDDSA
jgi:GNAT superfamily N-acetyltransferase